MQFPPSVPGIGDVTTPTYETAVNEVILGKKQVKAVFEEDKDRYGWVDLMKKACAVVIKDSENNTPLSNLFVRLSAITQSAPPDNHLLGFKVHPLRM